MKVEGRATADLFRSTYFFLAFVAGTRLGSRPALLEGLFTRVFRWTLMLLLVYLIAAWALRDRVDDLELLYGKIDNVVSSRIFFPFSNPYDLALFCILPIIYFVLQKRMGLALCLIAVLIATQSRTGLLLLCLAFLICFVISRIARTRMLKFGALIFVAVVLLFILVVDLDDIRSTYLIANTIGLLEGQSTTLSRRFAQWAYLIDLPIFGWGTIRSADLVIENAVIYELYRTGLFGIYTLICFYGFPLALAARSVWSSKGNPLIVALAIFVLLTVAGFSTSVFIYQPKLSLIYWLAVGVLFAHVVKPDRAAAPFNHEYHYASALQAHSEPTPRRGSDTREQGHDSQNAAARSW
jgi:O-antigen ligase